MRRLPAFLRQSLLDDRGSEIARHEALAERFKLTIYSADPCAPGSTAAMRTPMACCAIFCPKGTDLTVVEPDAAKRHRQAPERSTARDPRLAHAGSSHEQGNQQLAQARCTRMLRASTIDPLDCRGRLRMNTKLSWLNSSDLLWSLHLLILMFISPSISCINSPQRFFIYALQ